MHASAQADHHLHALLSTHSTSCNIQQPCCCCRCGWKGGRWGAGGEMEVRSGWFMQLRLKITLVSVYVSAVRMWYMTGKQWGMRRRLLKSLATWMEGESRRRYVSVYDSCVIFRCDWSDEAEQGGSEGRRNEAGTRVTRLESQCTSFETWREWKWLFKNAAPDRPRSSIRERGADGKTKLQRQKADRLQSSQGKIKNKKTANPLFILLSSMTSAIRPVSIQFMGKHNKTVCVKGKTFRGWYPGKERAVSLIEDQINNLIISEREVQLASVCIKCSSLRDIKF